MIKQQNHHEGLSVSFITSMACNCACRYCYEFDKPKAQKYDSDWWKKTGIGFNPTYPHVKESCDPQVLNLETAKRFIDSLVTTPISQFTTENGIDIIEIAKKGIVLDFIGGDSLQEPELVDEILTYYTKRIWMDDVAEEQREGWRLNWRASISSNGVSLLNPKARRFCEKWHKNLSIGISVDGNPELHDLNRILFARDAGGEEVGSSQFIFETPIEEFDSVFAWFKHWFPDSSLSSKFTIAPNSYKYLLDSYEWLFNKGYRYFSSNRVMENNMFETPKQREEIDKEFNDLYYWVTKHRDEVWALPFDYNAHCLIQESSYSDLIRDEPDFHHCGMGNMVALHPSGRVYSCFRLVEGHNEKKDMKPFAIGTSESIYKNKKVMNQIRKVSAQTNYKMPEACFYCPLLKTCPACIAGEFAQSKGNIFSKDFRMLKQFSACHWHKLQTAYSLRYWRNEMAERRSHYIKDGQNYKIWWDAEKLGMNDRFNEYEEYILNLPEATEDMALMKGIN